MRPLFTALAALLLAAAPASAQVYRTCRVANGQRMGCGPWAQGKAVVQHDGAYRSCSLSNGRVMSCGAWYTGQTVALQDGALRMCRITNGRLFTCGPWFQGEAVLPE